MIADGQAGLNRLYALVWPPKPAPKASVPPASISQEDDKQVIARARQSRNGASFEALYRGDMNGCASESEARGALIFHLIYLTQGNAPQIERIYRTSGRDQSRLDDRRGDETFLEYEIRRALADYTGDYYTPPRVVHVPAAASTEDRLAALEAEVAELKRTTRLQAETIEIQRGRLQDMALELQAYRSHLGGDADVLIEVAREMEWRVAAGRVEEDGSVYVPYAAVVTRLVGKEADDDTRARTQARVTRAMAKADASNVLKKWTESRLIKHDEETGEIFEEPQYRRRTFVRWGSDYTTMIESLASSSRPEDAPKRGGWRPRCPEHPKAPVITTHRCSACLKLLTPPDDEPTPPDDTSLSYIPTPDVEVNADDTNLYRRELPLETATGGGPPRTVFLPEPPPGVAQCRVGLFGNVCPHPERCAEAGRCKP